MKSTITPAQRLRLNYELGKEEQEAAFRVLELSDEWEDVYRNFGVGPTKRTPGLPDIFAFHVRTGLWCFEIKFGNAQPSLEQLRFENQCQRHGVNHFRGNAQGVALLEARLRHTV